MTRKILGEVGRKHGHAPAEGPGPPRAHPRGCGVLPRDPGREKGSGDDARRDRHLGGNADPHAQAAGDARERKPTLGTAARGDARRLGGRHPWGGHPGKKGQDASKGADVGQPQLVGHTREEPGGKGEHRRHADREKRGGKSAEPPGHKDRRAGQEQQLKQGVGNERGPLDAYAKRAAGQHVVKPCKQAQPPTIGRCRVHVAAERGVLVVDMAHARLPAGEHLLGLGDPLEAVLVALGDDELPLTVRVSGRGARVGNVRRPRAAHQAGHGVDPLRPHVAGPCQVAAGTDRERHPHARENPGNWAHSGHAGIAGV